jgi:hypothetical protein
MIAGRIHRRLAAPQLGDLPRLAGLGGEVGQSLEGGLLGRIRREDGLEGRALGLAVAIPGRQPGPRGEHLGPGPARSGQVGRGAPDFIGPADRLGPLEAAPPDGRVVGPRPFATVQPLARLVEAPRADRQVGRGQPDQVIVGGGSPGLGHQGGDPIDRMGIAIDAP